MSRDELLTRLAADLTAYLLLRVDGEQPDVLRAARRDHRESRVRSTSSPPKRRWNGFFTTDDPPSNEHLALEEFYKVFGGDAFVMSDDMVISDEEHHCLLIEQVRVADQRSIDGESWVQAWVIYWPQRNPSERWMIVRRTDCDKRVITAATLSKEAYEWLKTPLPKPKRSFFEHVVRLRRLIRLESPSSRS